MTITPPSRAAEGGTSSPVPEEDPTNNNSNPNPNSSSSSSSNPGNRPRSPSPSPTSAAVAPVPAGLAAVLEEKDARIAALEGELAQMEVEFRRALERASAAEGEAAAAAAFWRGKCVALERRLATLLASSADAAAASGNGGGGGGGGSKDTSAVVEERGVVGEGNDDDADDDDEAQAGGECVGQGRCGKGETGRGEAGRGAVGEVEMSQLRRAWEAAREGMARRDEEITALRAQVRGLKEWVSVSTRPDGQAQTSDEVFGEGMARLANGLQNWVLVNFRRAKIGELERDLSFCMIAVAQRAEADCWRRPVKRRRSCEIRAGSSGAHVRRSDLYAQNTPAPVDRVAAARGNGL